MAECSSEELIRALTDPFNFTCSNRGEVIGLTITIEAGLLSLVAILFVCFIIMRNVRWRIRHFPTTALRIFHQPMDILMASLLIADVVQAVGIVMNLKWVQAGKVEYLLVTSTLIGIVKIFGSTGVAFSTLAIAIYTFFGVWAMKDVTSMRFTVGVVVASWSFIAALVAMAVTLNHSQTRNASFIGPTPYWCWINESELGWRIGIEYLWMWLTLALSLLIYISLYLWMRGNLVIPNEEVWWRFFFKFRTDVNPEIRARRRQSLVMLAYPAVYCVCVLPLSATRWKSFIQGNSTVPPAATFIAASLFGLSGLFNSILLVKTRPSSGLFGQLMFLPLARPPTP